MILITVLEKNGSFVSLEIKGHANSAPKGEDLVCSAVSAIAVGGLNSLQDPKGTYDATVESGCVRLVALKRPSQRDQIALETIISQLESVAESQKAYVKLERKEP